jgi:hypothetical protein
LRVTTRKLRVIAVAHRRKSAALWGELDRLRLRSFADVSMAR